LFALAIKAVLIVPIVTLLTIESARWFCNFQSQLECFGREEKEFSEGITAEERAESLEMLERGVVTNKGELMVVGISIGELVILFVSALLTDQLTSFLLTSRFFIC